jgi:hypothetical protein
LLSPVPLSENHGHIPAAPNLFYRQRGTLVPGFAAETTEYTVNLAHDVETITVSGVPNHERAALGSRRKVQYRYFFV